MNDRQPLIIAVIWLATVATASTATWGVISATGAQVGQAITPLAPLPTEPSISTPSSAPASPSASPTQGPSQTAGTSRPSTSTRPSTSKPTSAPPSPPRVTDTWSGTVGSVTASCTGTVLKLVSAVPAVGYRVHVETERGQLEVEFAATSQNGEDERDEEKAELKVTCSDGRPVFRMH